MDADSDSSFVASAPILSTLLPCGQWQHAYARGVAINLRGQRSMTDRFFYNADGEMLIVRSRTPAAPHGDGNSRSRSRRLP